MRAKRARRVTWRVRRVPDGWLPVVLIGEQRVTLAAQCSRALARDLARSRAKVLSEAGS